MIRISLMFILLLLLVQGCKKLPTISEENPIHYNHPDYKVFPPTAFDLEVTEVTDVITVELAWRYNSKKFISGLILEKYDHEKDRFIEYEYFEANERSFTDTTQVQNIDLRYRLIAYIKKSDGDNVFSEPVETGFEQQLTSFEPVILNSEAVQVNWEDNSLYEGAKVIVEVNKNSSGFNKIGEFNHSESTANISYLTENGDEIEFKAYLSTGSLNSPEINSSKEIISVKSALSITPDLMTLDTLGIKLGGQDYIDQYVVTLISADGTVNSSFDVAATKATTTFARIPVPDPETQSDLRVDISVKFGSYITPPVTKNLKKIPGLKLSSTIDLPTGYTIYSPEFSSDGSKIIMMTYRVNAKPEVWSVAENTRLSDFPSLGSEAEDVKYAFFESSSEEVYTYEGFVLKRRDISGTLIEDDVYSGQFVESIIVDPDLKTAYIQFNGNSLDVYDLERSVRTNRISMIKGGKPILVKDAGYLIKPGIQQYQVIETEDVTQQSTFSLSFELIADILQTENEYMIWSNEFGFYVFDKIHHTYQKNIPNVPGYSPTDAKIISHLDIIALCDGKDDGKGVSFLDIETGNILSRFFLKKDLGIKNSYLNGTCSMAYSETTESLALVFENKISIFNAIQHWSF